MSRGMLAKWTALAGTALVLLACPAGAAASTDTVSCAAGRTIFRHNGVRIVMVAHETHFRHEQNSPVKTYYVCPRGAPRGREFRESTPFTGEQVTDFKVFGGRIGFVARSEGVQSGSEEQLGWVEVNTARSKSATISASQGIPREQEIEEEAEGVPPIPHFPQGHLNYVIASDGAVAVAGTGEGVEAADGKSPEESQVCLLTVKRHGLSSAKKLFRTESQAEAVVLDSLAISETAVTWSLVNGQAESAAR